MPSEHWPRTKTKVPASNHGWLCPDTKLLLGERLGPDTRAVVEIGSWLGRSARFILQKAPNAHLYCIDTWQGSPEHHKRDEWRAMLPTLYETFLVNLWDQRERVTPLRMRSVDGLNQLARQGVQPSLIYVDGDHSHEGVYRDLTTAHVLFPEAAIVGDDWRWKSVKAGVRDFLRDNPALNLTTREKAWAIDT